MNDLQRFGCSLVLFFYVVQCAAFVGIYYWMYDNPAHPFWATIVTMIEIFVFLMVILEKTKISARNFLGLKLIITSFMDVAMCYMIGNSYVIFIFIFLQWIEAQPFLSKQVYNFLYCVQVFMLVLLTFIPGLKILEPFYFVFGILCLGMCYLLSICMQRYIFVHEEQVKSREQSLDDILKVVGMKCMEARASNKERMMFLSNMSHEIRTPINTVLGMNEMILRESDDYDVLEYARNVETAGKLMLSIVNDILDFSKIDSGQLDLVIGEYDVSSLINDLVNMVYGRCQEKKLGFIVEVDPSIPAKAMGDDVRIRQAVMNLLSNAVKYTRKGEVTLKVGGHMSQLKENTFVFTFSVKDTGIGIRQHEIDKLFKVFTRLDQENNRYVEGSGLGLAITRSLLGLMDTDIRVQSVYGAGSEFSFDLEQQIVDEAPIGNYKERFKRGVTNSDHISVFTAPEANILVVDDNFVNRKVFTALLKKSEMKIDEAESGVHCLELCEKKKYDIIFMDHMMPGMDGIETFHAIRSDENALNYETKVVVLTANAIAGAREQYLNEGFDAFLSKPIEPSKLEHTICVMLDPSKVRAVDEISDETKAIEEPSAENGAAKDSESEYGAFTPKDFSELPNVTGLDWNYAKMHLENIDLVVETVRDFYRGMEADARELEGYLKLLENNAADREALAQFRVKVHSMKSNANLIGLVPAGGFAAILEYSAADGNPREVMKLAPSFLEKWRAYREDLAVFDEKKTELKSTAGEEKAIKRALMELSEAIDALDMNLSDEIMEYLREFDFGEEGSAMIDELGAAAVDFDLERSEKIIEGIRELL